MNLELDGQVAIVTGASRGIGRAIAEALARDGAQVVAVARESPELKSLGNDETGRIVTKSCDVTDRAALANIPEAVVKRFGRLDAIVNNAGGGVRSPFVDMNWQDWDEQIAINLTATVVLTQAAGRYLVDQGHGKVVNLASTTSLQGVANLVGYCTAKGAVLQFTRALAIEWAPFGVQVNAIGPGAIETDAQRGLLEGPREALEARLARIPDGRMGKPEEVAALARFLVSQSADHVTGALFMIDGGESVVL